MASSATPAPESTAPVNSFSRIIGVIFSPKATFESIVARPNWVVPFILLCIMGTLITALFTQHVGWRGFIERQIEQSPTAQRQMEQLTPEQRDDAINQRAKYAPAFGYFFSTVGAFIALAIVAGVYLGVFNMLGGAKMNFKTSMAIVTYSWMPLVIHGLLGILVIFLKDPATVDIQNLVASNPAAFLADDAAKWLVALLTSLDLFVFWVMILLALGYSATNPKKLPFGKTLATVVGVWVFYLVVKVGLTAAFS